MNKNVMNMILGLTISIVGLGCASDLQRQSDEYFAWKKTLPDANANYGSIPKNPQELIKSHLGNKLKDPDSAKYSEFSAPKQGYAIVDRKSKIVAYGYAVCAYFNAKNSYGGYTGNKMYWFLIKNDNVVLSKNVSSTQFLSLIYGSDMNKCLTYDYSIS